MTALPYVLLDDSLTPGGRGLMFTAPEEVISVSEPGEVEDALKRVSDGIARGLHAAGYFAYELGYCLEPKLRALMPEGRHTPLLWIGLFKAPQILTADLALTQVVEKLGARATNVHFQDQHEDGTITFDYRVHPGIVTKSNALELMRAVGLDV